MNYLKTLNVEYFHISPGVLDRISKELKKIGYKRVYVVRRSLSYNDSGKYIVIAESTTGSKFPYMWTFYDDKRRSFKLKFEYISFDRCYASALDQISNADELLEKNRVVLNTRLQDLYDILCQVINLSPEEGQAESDEWEELFAECVNLEQAFKDVGTEDGIVPKHEE